MPNTLDYFNSKIVQELEKNQQVGIATKFDDLRKASADKIDRLNTLHEQQVAARIANEKSFVSKLDLDTDSLAGKLTNLAANVYDGASTIVAGTIASLPDALASAAAEGGMSEEDTAAFNRYRRGEATFEDKVRLNQPKLHSTQVDTPEAQAETYANLLVNPQPSKLQLFEKGIQHRAKQQNILKAFNVNDVVHKDVGNKYVEDLGKDFQPAWDQVKQGASDLFQQGNVSGSVDLVSGIGKLIYNAGEATLNNKEAALGFIANNIPQLAVGALGKVGMVGMTASNVGYAADYYQQGITAYQKEHGGDLPPPDVRSTMALKAASLALAEHVSDVSELGIAGAFNRGTKDAARIGFKESLKNISKAGGGGALTEAPTEGFQTYMEGEITGKPASAQDIYVGTTIGGVVGGGLTSGGRAIAEGVGATPQHAEKRERDRQVEVSTKEAIETGDVSPFLDQKNPAFNPSKAVGVLYANSQREDTAPETKTTNLQKAHEIVSGLEEKRSDLQLELDSYDTNQLETKINTYKEHLAKATDPGLQERLTQAITDTEMDLTEAQTAEATKRAKVLSTQLGLMDQQITSARKVLDQFAGLVQPKEVDIKAAVEAADTIPDAQDTNAVESSKKAVERVLTLAMAHPDSFTTEHLDQLASNTKNGLTEPQRQYLRATSAARIAENALKSTSQVSKEVLEGDPAKNQLGIVDYRKKIGEALLGGNQKRADRFLGMLTSFANNHADKRVLVNKLYQDARSQKTSFDIIPMKGGKWKQTTEQRSEEALRAMGGLRISAASPKLVRAVNVESRALTQAQAALSAAYDLKFTKKATVSQGTSGTSVTSTVDQGQLQSKVDTTVNKTEVPVNTAVATTKKAQEAPVTTEEPEVVVNIPLPKKASKPDVRHLSGAILSVTDGEGLSLDTLEDIVHTSSIKELSTGRNVFRKNSTITDMGQIAEWLNEAGWNFADGADLTKQLEQHLTQGTVYRPDVAEAKQVLADKRAERDFIRSKAEEFGIPEGRLDALRKKVNAILNAEEAKHTAEVESLNPDDRARYDALLKTAIELIGSSTKEMRALDGLITSISENVTDDVYFQEAANQIKDHIDDLADSRITKAKGTQESNQVLWPQEDRQTIDEDGGTSDPVEETEGTPGTNGTHPGRLSLFDKASTYVAGQLGKVVDAAGNQYYQKLNLVREWLSQDSKDNTQRPLVAEANFLESWDLKKYLGGREPTVEQGMLLNDFRAKATKWLPVIQKNLVKGKFAKKLGKVEDNPDFYFNDPVQFLVENSLDGANMAENAKLAIAQAAYGHIIENSGSPALNTVEDVKAMFGVREFEDFESGALYEALAHGWNTEKAVINSLGARVTQALGFKETDKATVDFLPKLQATLGAHVMKLLLDVKAIERTTVHTQIIKDSLPERLSIHTVVGPNTVQGFLRFKRNEGETVQQRALVDLTKNIAELSKNTQGVFTKLFGVEATRIEPSWEPITSRQRTTKNTLMGIPKLLKRAIKHEDSVPNHLRQDMWHLFNVLDKETFLAIAGAKDFDPKTTHDLNQTSYTAINEALNREYENAEDYFIGMEASAPDGLKQAMYFPHIAWKPQRVGIGSNVINPQSSKLQRHMLYRPEWETEVSSTDGAMMENFALRIAEGFGIKTDKQANENSLTVLNQLLNTQSDDPKTKAKALILKAAIDALREIKQAGEKISPELQQAILKGVEAGGEKMHSLDSLMALADYEDALAKAKGSDFTFTVRLMGEVDGVANGPMLSHLLLGAANTVKDLGNLLNKGGFFRGTDGHKNYNVYRGTPGNRDLYETTTGHVIENLGTLSADNSVIKAILPALWAITGELSKDDGSISSAGRNIIKTPLTAMLFGSAMKGAINSMFRGFVEKIYAGFEDIAKLPADEREVAREVFLGHINTLLQAGGYLKPLNLSIEELLLLDFNKKPAMLQALENSFNGSLGEAVTKTMEKDFAAFLEARNTINKTAQATFEMYNAAYQAIRDTYIQELIESGEMAYAVSTKTGKKLPSRHALTKPQEKVLADRVKAINPVVHTYMSKLSKDLDSGIHISSSDRKLSTDPAYRSQVKFGTSFEDSGDVNFTTAAFQRILTTPGVSIVPMLIHSLDSGISHSALMGTQVLNVHDAHGTGLKYFTRTAQNLNAATWKATLNFSPTSEVRDAWIRTLTGMAEMLKDGNNKNVVAVVHKTLAELAKANPIGTGKEKVVLAPSLILDHLTRNIFTAAYQADKTKYDTMKVMYYVDQYALEGGQHDVTEDERKQASELSDALINTIPAEVTTLLDTLNAALGLQKEQAVETASIKSVWGELGTSRVKSDSKIEQRFKAKPIMTGVEALRVAYANLDKNPRMEAFYKHLLPQIAKVMPKDLTVTYITPETVLEEVTPGSGSRAWYVDTAKGNIYVLSSAFKDSGLTAEVLIHEILHGVLVKTIETDQSPEVRALVQELETLRAKAAAYVAESVPENQRGAYAPALGSVHELISWGMSNKDFQQNVLNKISMQSQTKGNVLITGLKHFIDTLVGILFKGSTKTQQQINESGMTVLINNVSGLFAAVKLTDKTTNTSYSMASTTVRDFTTTELYESLDAGKVTPGFNAHLKSLLSSIVEKIHGPYGSFKESRMKQTALDPLSIITNAMQDGAAPLFRELRTNGISMDDRSAFVGDQVYAAMTAALTDNEGYSTVAARELAKLYNEAYETIKVEDFVDDWSKASQAEKDQATATYNAIFKMEKVSGEKTDHLARFGALGLTHPQFNKLLQFNTKQVDTVKGKTLAEQLQKLFARVLDWINNLVTHTYNGQRADTKLELLVEQLIQIESKKVARLKKKAASTDYVDMADSLAKDLLAKGIGQVSKVVGSSFIRNNKSKVVAATGALVRVVANDQVDVFLKVLADYRNKNWQQNLGLMAGLLNNVVGPKKVIEQLLRGSKHIESMRTAVITQTRAAVLNAYANGGEALTEKANKAITAVLLRTGAHVLLDHMNMVGLHEVVSSRAARLRAIKTLEDQLNVFGNFKKDFLYQSKALAFHIVTGDATSEFLTMNAHNIARLLGTNNPVDITEQEAVKAEPIIDALISLYAIDYTDQHHLNAVANVLSTENARTDGNGVEFSLVLQRKANEQAKEKLFVDAGALMVKGYTPEVFNPYTTVKAANAMEGKHLIGLGYIQGPPLPKDPKDPGQEVRHIYILKDDGLLPYLSGIVSHTGMRHKGTLREDSYIDPTTYTGQQNQLAHNQLTAAKQAAVRHAIDNTPHFDPTKSGKRFMVPVINAQGDTTNWRYMMQEKTKDDLLERDNRSEQVLGMLAGNVFDKESTNTQNRKAIEALHAEFKESFALRADAFVEIGPKAADPVNQEIYRLLPEVTKQAIREVWGNDSMQVPVEMVDVVFGYRKSTISSVFDKVAANRKRKATNPTVDEFEGVNAMEHAIIFGVEWALKNYAKGVLHKTGVEAEQYAKRGAVVVRRAERAWQEAVKVTKDIIVIRSGMVMAGNIMSNFSLLKLQGVSWADILHSHRVGMRGATAYNDDSKKLFQLRTQLESGYSHINVDEVKREILKLEDAIARNPVKELIDAGLMPTIVEDMETATDPYSYKSALLTKMEKYTDKINPKILAAAKTVVVAQDTQLYKTFSEITQLSDFVARYTLYQHLVSRKRNPLDAEAATQEASEAFINYDLPMHRTMQYLEDMGLTMFTKYFLGIQRVLAKNLKEHPLRMLTTLLLDKYLHTTSLVTESAAIFHIGHDPFRAGALQLPGAVWNTAPIQASMSLIK